LIVRTNRCAAFGGFAVDPNLTDAEYLFEGRAVTSNRLGQDLRDAFSINLIVANTRGFSSRTK
jgi:hypothetical protein